MTPPPLPGFRYEQRNGWVTPPLRVNDDKEYPLQVSEFMAIGWRTWTADGRYSRDSEDQPFDLIRRVYISDTPPASVDRAMVAAMVLAGLGDWTPGFGGQAPEEMIARRAQFAVASADALDVALRAKPVAV